MSHFLGLNGQGLSPSSHVFLQMSLQVPHQTFSSPLIRVQASFQGACLLPTPLHYTLGP